MNTEIRTEETYTFSLSEEIIRQKVNFKNRYGITLGGDLYLPKNHQDNLPGIVVCGPFGAAKEPKELCVIPRACQIDFYNQLEIILFDKLQNFFRENLK